MGRRFLMPAPAAGGPLGRPGCGVRRSGDGRSAVDVDRLAVIILTQNEEAHLARCLESLRGLDCEVFVVDSGSTDRTRRIAEEAGAAVVGHPFVTYAAQRNWAQENLPLRSGWILHLDAAERLTPELVAELNRMLEAPPAGLDGFLIRRRIVFMGRWLRHGGQYPVYHLRLYRKGRGRCEERLYDQHFVVDGQAARLRNDFIDETTSDLKTWMYRHMHWAELERDELMRRGARTGYVRARLFGTPIERRRWLRNHLYYRAPRLARAFAYWGYRYIVQRGFLDGPEGLIYHGLQGFWYRFYVDALLHEATGVKEEWSTRV